MKLASLIDSLTADIWAVIEAYNIDFATLDHGATGLKAIWTLLAVVSRNRAYDDSHPGFASGTWKRVLPYDGRDYCFYYQDGSNDDHVVTLLKSVKKQIAAKAI